MRWTRAVRFACTLSCFLAGCYAAPDPDASPEPGLGSAAQPVSGWAPCDAVFSLEHQVPVRSGVSLHVVEKFSSASLATHPRRAIIMLTGTLVTNQQYDTSVPGDASYNALARAAQEGYFAFSPSYEGYGESSLPADGSIVTAERLLQELGVLVEWVRHTHGVSEVDLLGTSLGSSLAVALGGIQSPINRKHVGRLVLTSNVYKEVTPLFQSVFFTPELFQFLSTAPNGYVQTVPEAYGLILSNLAPDASAWAAATFPGVYATGPTLQGFDLPIFEAKNGRAPALQVWGDQDPITPLSDVARFQTEYGGPVELSVIAGGGHALTLEPVREAFWQEALAFLDDGRPARHPCGCPDAR